MLNIKKESLLYNIQGRCPEPFECMSLGSRRAAKAGDLQGICVYMLFFAVKLYEIILGKNID